MKNERASYKYINDRRIFEICKTLDGFWFVIDENGYYLLLDCFTTKRDCKKAIENRYGKIYTPNQWRKRK